MQTPPYTLRCSCSSYLVRTSLLISLVMTACGTPRNDAECVSDGDCALGFLCVDGSCERRPSNGGGGGLAPPPAPDSGSLFRFDAGLPDAGRPDGGGPTTDAGDAGPSTDAEPAGQVCGQAACLAQGAECGMIVDECGTTVDCPDTCGSGSACGIGAFTNRCQCRPQPCSVLGARCGSVTDNCGVRRDCSAETGGCGSNQECRNNQCIQSCQPASCSNRCGRINDGCGGYRDCGGCGPGQTCNASNYCENRPVIQTGFRFPTSVSSSTWRNRQNVTAKDGVSATIALNASNPPVSAPRCNNGRVTLSSGILQAGGFGFNIPSGATIVGIVTRLRVRSSYTGNWEVERVQLTTGNSASQDLGDWLIRVPEGSFATWNRGGNANTRGRSWTPPQINDRSFGVSFDVKSTVDCAGTETKTLRLDSIEIDVYFRPR